jgi:hypothetical protein
LHRLHRDGRRCTAPLFCQGREVLLPTLQGRNLLAGCVLEVHSKPQDRDQETRRADDDVLRDLFALFAAELSDLLVVGLNFRVDGGAVHIAILSLRDSDWRRRTAGAGSQLGRHQNEYQSFHFLPAPLRALSHAMHGVAIAVCSASCHSRISCMHRDG